MATRGQPARVVRPTTPNTATHETSGANPAAAAARAGATARTSVPSKPEAALAGQAKHRQLEQEYITNAPIEQRPFIVRVRTVIDPVTGKRMRADIVNHETGEIVEFKPRSHQDGAHRQSQAEDQVQKYVDYYNQRFGDQRELDGAPRYFGGVEYYDP